jgi:Tol biopolymer transport system component
LFTRLVWLCPRCDQDEVFSVKPDGSDVVWITNGYGSRAPAWAPDGTRFVAVTANGLEIFSGDGERLATLRRSGTAPAWQPLPVSG